MRGINCRGLRLELVAAFGIALALPGMQAAAANAQGVSTQTTLTVAGSDAQQRASITVTGADGLPAGGVVNIEEGSRLLSQIALNGMGQADADLSLPGGSHALRAVYLGDATHQASASDAAEVQPQSSTNATPNFQLSVAAVSPGKLPLTLTPGQAGTISVTVTPIDNAALTAPMFITLSCSGLPQQASCTFTPEEVEITPTTPASCSSGAPPSVCPPTSLMLLQTQAQAGAISKNRLPANSVRRGSPVAWALLLPGALGFGFLAWGTRRRRWLQRLALVALVGLVTTLGTAGCNPLYYYETHGPPPPPATPSGTYNVIVTAQASNGITAITNSTTMVLTVN